MSKEVDSGVDFTIRVINPKYKREAKTYVLHSVPMTHITTLKRFKEIILEQLGKNVVCFSLEFDVGYIVGSSKICFSQSDDVKTELGKIKKKGYNLWCEGLDVTQKRPLPVSECGGNSIVVVDDSDSEEYTCKPPAKHGIELQ